MGVAVVGGAAGNRETSVGASEPNGYLRSDVGLNDGEILVRGPRGSHAEADIVGYAQENGLTVVDIGATRQRVTKSSSPTTAQTGPYTHSSNKIGKDYRGRRGAGEWRLICNHMRIYDAHEKGDLMQAQSAPKKPTNLTLDQGLLSEARSFGVNLSQAAEAGLRRAVRDAKAAAWKRENAKALEASNHWVEEKGLPLEKYRLF